MAEGLVMVILQKITSALGEEGFKLLVSKLKNHAPDLLEITSRMRLLQSDFSMMQAYRSQVDAKMSNDKVLEARLDQVGQAAHETEDIVDQYVYIVGHLESSDGFLKKTLNRAAPVKQWRKLAARVKSVEDHLQKITEMKNRFDVSVAEGGRDDAWNYSSRHLHLSECSYLTDDDDFVGNSEVVRRLTEWLLDGTKDRSIVSICGMGGLGKTTLASRIYKKEEVKRMFICRAWISVSQSYRVRDLLKRILLQLLSKNENIDLAGLDTMDCVNIVEQLQRYLKNRRYLIVLHDVWIMDAWPLLDNAFSKNSNGSRIIITTRIEADANREMKLRLLPKEEAWILFCRKAFSRVEGRSCPINLNICAEKIVALVAIGSLLSYKEMDEHDWESFYGQLRWQLSNNPELSWVASVLNLSYNDLPSYLKNCFP